jgi:phage tail sheath protein FI
MATISNVSPNINIREFDYSTSNPIVLPFSSATVFESIWGPCFQRKQVTTENELLRYFGKPNNTNYECWYNCSEYLRYANNLWVVRVVDSATAKNAGIACTDDVYGTNTLPLNTNPYIPNHLFTYNPTFDIHEKLKIVAKYPGTFGNTKIKVAISNATDFSTANVNSGTTFKESFEYAPKTNAYDYFDQIAIVVLVQNNVDENWNIVEKYVVDLNPAAKDYANKSNYVENVVNSKSEYIYIYDNSSLLSMPNSFEETLLYGGVDSTPDEGDYETGYDLYSNSEEFPIRYIFDSKNDSETTQKYIVSLCNIRLDCFGILSVPKNELLDIDISTAVTNALTYKNTTLNENSSYYGIYGNAKYMYDRYNDKYRWISMSGDVAGAFVETASNNAVWYAPAGTNCQIKNALRLAIEPNLAYRDTLYSNGVNPIVSINGGGIQIYGQKTGTSTPSAFDRVNVRLLFLELESVIRNSAKNTLFKNNTPFTRNLFKLQIDPKLRSVQANGGIYEYQIVCDETNNTQQVIDTNNFVVDVYIKPGRTIEYININFTSVGSGIAISEIIRS